MFAVISIFIVIYFLIATEKIDKTIAALLGAAIVVFVGLVPYETLLEKVNLNVLFLLIGMMIIVGILSLTGVFEWIAITLAQKAKGNGIVIMILFLFATAAISSVLDNVTTIILMAPITILICQLLKIPVQPLLILEAIFSNIGGASTLIGDPPNIIIAMETGLSFHKFLVNLAPVILVICVVSIAIVSLLFHKRYRVDRKTRREIMQAKPNLAIVEPRMLIKALFVFCGVLLAFFSGHHFHLDPGLVALTGALVMILVTRVDLHSILHVVEWHTILFFVGLFMLIGALEAVGAFESMGHQITVLTGGNLMLTALAILWSCALFSAIVDNIPLVIAMIPVIQTIIPVYALQLGLVDNPKLIQTAIAEPLYWALALGACLGGNGTLVGATANVVVAQVAHRNNYKMTFWDFTRYGFPLMIVSLIISTMYIALRYFPQSISELWL